MRFASASRVMLVVPVASLMRDTMGSTTSGVKQCKSARKRAAGPRRLTFAAEDPRQAFLIAVQSDYCTPSVWPYVLPWKTWPGKERGMGTPAWFGTGPAAGIGFGLKNVVPGG